MSDYTTVKPDLEFVREIQESGGDSLKKCFQCATCSVVCELSPDENPYPRKEMIWAQWGMADRLAKDSHVWLCHQCSDCTAQCPRGAKPAEVLGAIRAALIRRFATPRFVGDIVGDVHYFPLVLAFVAAMLLLIRNLVGGTGIPLGEIEYAKFFPHGSIYIAFGGGFALMALSIFISGRRFWKAICEGTAQPKGDVSFVAGSIAAIKEILVHSRFGKCGESKQRRTSHLFLFYSFATLFVVTSIVAPMAWMGLYPFGLWHPLKVLGNLGGIALLVGIGLLIMDRAAREEGEKHAFFDWFFLITILVLGVTGMAAMAMRIITNPEHITVGYATAAYGVYFVHLIAVFVTIQMLPFTKFGHMVYRFLAMVHAKMAGIPTGGV